MPQGRMTEEQAYALAKQQRKANDLRRAGGSTGGFKGIEKPGEAVQVMMNGRKAFVSGSGITDDSGPAKAPRSFLNDIGDAVAKSRQVYANRDAGMPSKSTPVPTPPERKVNMQSGMGNTDAKKVFAEKPSVTQGMLASNPLDYIKKTPGGMRDALGFGTDMLSRGLAKGNTGMVKADYIERLKGADVFRKLDSTSQGHVMKAYQQWLNSQSTFNEGKRKTMAVDKDFNRTFGQTDGMF
jgi:hypothetical protein